MKTLKCKELRKGMRVLLSKPDEEYTIGKSNPLVGTEWECTGTIYTYGNTSVTVDWDNGKHNSYKDNELSLSHEERCKSIW